MLKSETSISEIDTLNENKTQTPHKPKPVFQPEGLPPSNSQWQNNLPLRV
jgi:hypothetical protein